MLDQPHRRLNPLTGEWVLVCAHRTDRPWLGAEEDVVQVQKPEFDPDCYLCPGVERANGQRNPEYTGIYTFTNDFPALIPHTVSESENTQDLRRWETTRGTSKVLCYSSRHDLSLGELSNNDLLAVVKAWIDESRALFEDYDYVQIFENRGSQMGASNPHPHGQIWAGDFIPTEIMKEQRTQKEYWELRHQNMLMEYLKLELHSEERVLFQNQNWAVLVPFWATWPFETIVLPKVEVSTLMDLSSEQQKELVEALKKLISMYDLIFNTPFPYSMGWHQAPRSIWETKYWTLHAHFYPPLLRSAAIRKFMVGYELMAEAQRDITPEVAAATMRKIMINKGAV